jgi:dihydroneopterin aldolase
LFLSGIRASGRHGARPGEKGEPQDLVVDLDVEVNVGDDHIEGTADYRGITETVRSIVEERSFDLIESLAAIDLRAAVMHTQEVCGRRFVRQLELTSILCECRIRGPFTKYVRANT